MKRLNILGLAALPISIAALYGLDVWLETLRRQAGESLNWTGMVWTTPIINLFYAAMLLGLFALVNRARERWLSAVYLVAGLVLLLYPSLRMTVLADLPVQLRDALPYSAIILHPLRGMWLVGAFVTVVGAWTLFKFEERVHNKNA